MNNHTLSSLDDIFNNDDFGLLENVGNIDILGENTATLNVKKRILDVAKDIGERFVCEDFEHFKPVFFKLEQIIAQNQYHIEKENPTQYIKKNAVFVLMGMLCFIADIEIDEKRKNKHFKERIRLIFANGTESNMLARSLATALSKHKVTSYHLAITNKDWQDLYGFNISPEQDMYYAEQIERTGEIYIAKLKTPKAEFINYPYLHKIGFTRQTGIERIANCMNDEAFLYSEVEIIAEYQTNNANTQKIEYILHSFFAKQKLNLKLLGKDGHYYTPTEWFNVPLSEIDKAIELINIGEIGAYYYNDVVGRVERKVS
ncbi:GIY-YIG nuclease family protein [Moraxella sp. ZY210820]|uniref:GIY-YIG nuclease family protein n=1 Tax=unclassified Moraxella TaxID=2685852 RepID=UPI0027316759|nr:GIY-YIG nuclease family protein [Moraxella sp. ZY210820]WLF83993.1 GIY-YIG nuclease family protein [Moraxella sp. ZY210820]